MEAYAQSLDWPIEALLAVALAVFGGLLLLVGMVWDRAQRRGARPASALISPALLVAPPPPRGGIGAAIEFMAPVVVPAGLWFGLRELTGAAAVPAIVGMLSFLFARRAVRWLLDLPVSLRTGRIERGMDDMLEMMSLCIEAGLGVEQMLAEVEGGLRSLHPELAGELARLRHQVTLLPDRSEGYRQVAQSTPAVSLREVVLVLERAERTGTELGPMLKLLINDLAARNERNAEAVAQRLPVYLVMVLVLLFMPAVMLILVGPSYVRLLEVLRSIAKSPWGP